MHSIFVETLVFALCAFLVKNTMISVLIQLIHCSFIKPHTLLTPFTRSHRTACDHLTDLIMQLNTLSSHCMCKKGLIHATNFTNSRLCNSACVWLTALKFGGRTVLLLHIQHWKFQSNNIHTYKWNEVMPFQSHKIRCVYKTSFCEFSHIYVATLVIIYT